MTELEDYRWLISPEAAVCLEQAAAVGDLIKLARRLRQSLSPTRAHLVLKQAELRRRAQEKFSSASQMFFTPLGLEQATDETVAVYKAERFPPQARLADLCCGTGGDLVALARRGPTLGVDRHPVAALLAEANARALGVADCVEVRVADVAEVDLSEVDAWHIDPDRRPAARRTTRVELHEPGPETIERLRAAAPQAGVKLAPAAELPEHWERQAELEWISRGGQCRQLVAWFGELANQPGLRRATVLRRGAAPRSVVGPREEEPEVAPELGRYIYEPDASVLAAGLTAQLARDHGLAALDASIAYLTGDVLLHEPALAGFEVLEVLPLDRKRLRSVLRQGGIGRLEIKKRGIADEPEQLRKELAPRGEQAATLILARRQGRPIAILAQRVGMPPPSPLGRGPG